MPENQKSQQNQLVVDPSIVAAWRAHLARRAHAARIESADLGAELLAIMEALAGAGVAAAAVAQATRAARGSRTDLMSRGSRAEVDPEDLELAAPEPEEEPAPRRRPGELAERRARAEALLRAGADVEYVCARTGMSRARAYALRRRIAGGAV